MSSVDHPALYSGGTAGTWTDLNNHGGADVSLLDVEQHQQCRCVSRFSPSSTSTGGVAVGGINCSIGTRAPDTDQLLLALELLHQRIDGDRDLSLISAAAVPTASTTAAKLSDKRAVAKRTCTAAGR